MPNCATHARASLFSCFCVVSLLLLLFCFAFVVWFLAHVLFVLRLVSLARLCWMSRGSLAPGCVCVRASYAMCSMSRGSLVPRVRLAGPVFDVALASGRSVLLARQVLDVALAI